MEWTWAVCQVGVKSPRAAKIYRRMSRRGSLLKRLREAIGRVWWNDCSPMESRRDLYSAPTGMRKDWVVKRCGITGNMWECFEKSHVRLIRRIGKRWLPLVTRTSANLWMVWCTCIAIECQATWRPAWMTLKMFVGDSENSFGPSSFLLPSMSFWPKPHSEKQRGWSPAREPHVK